MDSTDKILSEDHDGMASYEYLVNNIGILDAVEAAIDSIGRADSTGQFAASVARFLAAIGKDQYAAQIDRLLKQVIDKDRNKSYLPSLLSCIWGDDYAMRADELREKDDNFRRIYKRVHPSGLL